MRSRYEVEDRKNVYKSRDKRLLRRSGFVENLVRRRRDHLDIFGNERPPFDIFDEFRLDLVGQHLADARVLFDVGPLRNQKETLWILGVAAQHAVFHLRPRLVHGVAVRIGADEFLKATTLDVTGDRRSANIRLAMVVDASMPLTSGAAPIRSGTGRRRQAAKLPSGFLLR